MRTNRVRWIVLIGLLAVVGVGALYGLLYSDALLWMARANQWLADTIIARLGYWGVFGLMFIESSLIPFPSEIVIPPAADLARRLPDWQVGWVVLAGVAGSLTGALFNYALALYLGRPLLLRWIEAWGRYLHLTRGGYDRAEGLFLRHGAISTLTGRLIPGVRQIISLPAGLARMNLLAFCLLTALGAGAWVSVLAWLGYWFGANAEALSQAMREVSHWIVGGALGVMAVYGIAYAWRVRRGRAARPSSPQA